jgi:hypothetical protein
MDDMARWPAADRADLFTVVASQRGDMSAEIVEKDFWVCWILRRLFTLTDAPAGMIFKGGTSLSKAFHAIGRFSEDVDLSFDRANLGFGGDNDPGRASSKKQAKQRLKMLKEACQTLIRHQFLPRLADTIGAALDDPGQRSWKLETDEEDPDAQTVLFHYASGFATGGSLGAAYLPPVVRLEMGARSDHWPAETATVIPYAAEHFPARFQNPKSTVRVLAAERTFWEKATILHAWHHARPDKPLRDRQSRHYYDLVKLYEAGIGPRAIQRLDLLTAVAAHKAIFFADPAAKYDEAKPGSLRLVPPASRHAELRADYGKMQEMIFGEPPTFEHLLAMLTDIQQQINKPA